MNTINYGRVAIGGVVAGVLFFLTDWLSMSILGWDMAAWLTQHNMHEPAMANFIVMDLVLGILLVWLYAAIRPRFGAGLKTAAIAAAFFWVFFGVIYWGWTAMGAFTQAEYFKFSAWGAVQCLVSAFGGAWLYKEGAADTMAGTRI